MAPSTIRAYNTSDILDGSMLLSLQNRYMHNLNVYVSLSSKLVAPVLSGESWTIPFEIEGLDTLKGSTLADSRSLKALFHSSLPDLCHLYPSLANVVRDRVCYKIFNVSSFDEEWVIAEMLDHSDLSVPSIAHILMEQNCCLSVTSTSMEVCWHLHNPFSSIAIVHQQIRNQLDNLDVTVDENGSEGLEDEDSCVQQTLTVQARSNNKVLGRVMQLTLVSSLPYLKKGTVAGPWEVSKYCLRIVVPLNLDSQNMFDHDISRVIPHKLPRVIDFSIFDQGHKMEKMLDASQLRVESLRLRLDASLAAFQKAASEKNRPSRSLHVVRVNETEAMVEIGEHGARSHLDRILSNSSPLQVICDGTGVGEFASSPTDSGVSMSPLASPLSKHSPFYQYSEESRLGMRQRSSSESDWSAASGLKGILKKRVVRIGRFSRSVSECCPRDDDFALMRSPTLEEDEHEDDEEEEETGSGVRDRQNRENGGLLSPRKKHVSFSEKLVELRRFRSNQCILSQSKKAEKKRLSRQRKQERGRSLSLSDSHHQEEVVCDKPAALRTDRQDSGFADGDDDEVYESEELKLGLGPLVLNSPEQAWKQLLRQQRQIGAQ